MSTILELQSVSKSYGALKVTNNVSLSIEQAQCHVIIGPNGAGKTSLIHQIGGQLRSDSGRILLRGDNIAGSDPEDICRKGIARTFQKNNLFNELPVLENVRLAVQARHFNSWNMLRQVRNLSGLRERAEEILLMVHLTGSSRRLAKDLSYGEQRQLEIALALASDPDVLLLDEPTSGMSPAETGKMSALVASLPSSLTIVMIEHDMDVVFSLADTVTVLARGSVLATGTPAEIRANEVVHEVYLGKDAIHAPA